MTTETQKTITFNLPGLPSKTATLTITRAGQEAPAVGDHVVAEVQLDLPAAQDGWLISDLQFVNRVGVFREALEHNWGALPVIKGTRCSRERVKSSTWASAFRAAEAYGRAELGKLLDALKVRAQARADAENDPAPSPVPAESPAPAKPRDQAGRFAKTE